MSTRREFVARLAAATAMLGALPSRVFASAANLRATASFTFARLRYDSGDWDYNP
jgi:hypothetical protein